MDWCYESDAVLLSEDDSLSKSFRGSGADLYSYAQVPGAPFKYLDINNMASGIVPGVRDTPSDAFSGTGLSFETMRMVYHRCPVVTAIVRTRQNQVRHYCQVSRGRFQPGFHVTTRDRKQRVTPAAEKVITKLEQFVLGCGFKDRPQSQFRRSTLWEAVSQILYDSLVLDAAAIQKWSGLNSAKFPVSEFEPVDASEIRLTVPTIYQPGTVKDIIGIKERAPRWVHYVQVRDGKPIAEFSRDQLVYMVRNPRTDTAGRGYGTSEIEILHRIITGLQFGTEYNIRYFTNNSVPRGILSLIGNYNPTQLEAFKANWHAMLQGVDNAHRLAIIHSIQGTGAEWIPLAQNNRDMEFGAWIEFLICIVCMVYQMHPEEVGFKGWSQQKPSLSEGSAAADLEWSSDKGLVPLLDFLEFHLDGIIRSIDEDFAFTFVAKDRDEEQKAQARAQFFFGMGGWTLNQVLAHFDEEQIPKEELYGDMPIGSSSAMNIYNMMHGMDQASTQNAMLPNAQEPSFEPTTTDSTMNQGRMLDFLGQRGSSSDPAPDGDDERGDANIRKSHAWSDQPMEVVIDVKKASSR